MGLIPVIFVDLFRVFAAKLLGWSLHKKDYCPALGIPRSSGQFPEWLTFDVNDP